MKKTGAIALSITRELSLQELSKGSKKQIPTQSCLKKKKRCSLHFEKRKENTSGHMKTVPVEEEAVKLWVFL